MRARERALSQGTIRVFLPKEDGLAGGTAVHHSDLGLPTSGTQRGLRTGYQSHSCSPPVMVNIRYDNTSCALMLRRER